MNNVLNNLANHPDTNYIIRRLINQASNIFGEFNRLDYQNYQNIMDAFDVLRLRDLNEYNIEDLREFIDYGFRMIFNRYEFGHAIHPGTLNILVAAIITFNRASIRPYQVFIFENDDMPETTQFMNDIVQPAAQNLQMFALHHAPWVNPVFMAQEAARRAAEEAPGAETRIVRTLAEFRAMGGDQMDSKCPICLEAFIELPEDAITSKLRRMSPRHPIFLPVVFHKDVTGKWFHPIHTVCVKDLQEECPTCRVKVIWPRMRLNRKTRRRPNSVGGSKKSHTNKQRRSRRHLKQMQIHGGKCPSGRCPDPA